MGKKRDQIKNNSHSNRIYGKPVNLGYNNTKAFFSNRAKMKGKSGLLNITMYQDKNPGLAKDRDNNEKNVVEPYLKLTPTSRVLDIGCGVGRWGFYLADKVGEYLGTDFNDDLIEIANDEKNVKQYSNLHFQALSATELHRNNLLIDSPFNLFIIAGVMAYLNDIDCRKMLMSLPVLSQNGADLYIREPVSLTQRLTLLNYYSEELETHYNAIYRTSDEYLNLFSKTILNNGYSLSHCGELLPDKLKNQKETTQYIYLFKYSKQ